MIQHAYAILQVKDAPAGGAQLRFAGIATTPMPDRTGDILEPLGAVFTNPLPLLWHHDKERPIGTVTLHPATTAGITFDAVIPTIDEPGPLRDRTHEAVQTVKTGLIRAVSVGYRVLDGGIKRLRAGGNLISRFEICELSLVTVPANMHATIHTIKSLDAEYLTAPGHSSSGASELAPVLRTKGAHAMTAQEQITELKTARETKVARLAALMESVTAETPMDDSRKDAYDQLATEVKSLDEHLARAQELSRLMATTATAVTTPTAARPHISVKSNLPKGTAFARAAMALLATTGRYEAIQFAKRWESSTPEVELYLKAAVAPGTTTDPAWAGALAATQNITDEFLELLRPATILGRIPGLRQVPFNISVPIQTAGGSYGWVGQGQAKPVTSLAFGTAKLEISKAAGIVALTEELVRVSNPSAEAIVRDDMVKGIAQFLDQQFLDPAVAYVANVHPASITNGLTGVASTQNPLKDLQVLLAAFATAHVPMAGAVLIMNETNALAMSFQRDPTGARVFPGVTVNGGSAEGITVLPTSAAGQNVILLHPPAVLYADDGGVTIDVSREASIQMDSAPANPSDATTVLVSLWQRNMVGLRAERFINWKRAVDPGVALVTGAAYPATAIPAGGATAAEPEGKKR